MNANAIKAMLTSAAVVALSCGAAVAEQEPAPGVLVINGDIEITTEVKAPDYIDGLDMAYSGWRFRASETQAFELDDFDNPGMIFVEEAQVVWDTVDGSEGKSCASCHDGPESMKGVRAVYPKWNEAAGKVTTIEDEINNCRTTRMGAEAWDYNSDTIRSMNGLITLQSRGMPVNVAVDGPAKETWEKGKELYYARTGQLELSCANCHEDHYGDLIRAEVLSQGQINGFPVYRLKDSVLTGVHNRFKGCVRDTRAETYGNGSDEFRALELYVSSRGNGLSVEGPSVRN
jgi:sulfur-oxidizing protein SoxA